MSLLNAVYTRAVWPYFDPAMRGLADRLSDLRRQAREAPQEIEARRWQSLLRLLRHAYDSSPFYRHRFDAAGIDPRRISSPDDLSALPPLTRADLRDHLPEICSDRYRSDQLFPAATGGTTELPVKILRDAPAVAAKNAVQQSLWEWAGVRPGDKVFWLWGAVSDYAQNPSWRWRLYERHLLRKIWAPTGRMNPETMERYRIQFNRFRPDAVCAFPTPLYLFCEYLRDTGRPVAAPRAIICTAEALLPHQRELMEQTLRAPVFEQYGCREFGMIAGECAAHCGMHQRTSAAYIQYRRIAASPEAPYEMLVTDLLNYGMPLIRYQINDCVATPPAPSTGTACDCGRTLPLLPAIIGRSSDTLRLPDGTLVPGVALIAALAEGEALGSAAPRLARTQIVQEGLRQFRLRYVPGAEFSPAQLEPLKRKLDAILGAGLSWEFEAVPEIARESSGKTRFCISRLELN